MELENININMSYKIILIVNQYIVLINRESVLRNSK